MRKGIRRSRCAVAAALLGALLAGTGGCGSDDETKAKLNALSVEQAALTQKLDRMETSIREMQTSQAAALAALAALREELRAAREEGKRPAAAAGLAGLPVVGILDDDDADRLEDAVARLEDRLRDEGSLSAARSLGRIARAYPLTEPGDRALAILERYDLAETEITEENKQRVVESLRRRGAVEEAAKERTRRAGYLIRHGQYRKGIEMLQRTLQEFGPRGPGERALRSLRWADAEEIDLAAISNDDLKRRVKPSAEAWAKYEEIDRLRDRDRHREALKVARDILKRWPHTEAARDIEEDVIGEILEEIEEQEEDEDEEDEDEEDEGEEEGGVEGGGEPAEGRGDDEVF